MIFTIRVFPWLVLPIMTVYEYEIRYGDTEEGLVQGTHRVPNRPPSRDPTRPRKEGDYAVINTSVWYIVNASESRVLMECYPLFSFSFF